MVYWLDALGIFSALRLVLERIRGRGAAAEVQYLRLNPYKRWLLSMLRSLGFRPSRHPTDFALGDLRAPDGANLFYELEEAVDRIGRRAIVHIDVDRLVRHHLSAPYRSERVGLYLRRSINMEVYDTALDLWAMRTLASGPPPVAFLQSHVFVIRRSFFHTNILREHTSSSDGPLLTYSDMMGWVRTAREAAGFAKHLFGALSGVLLKLVRWHRGQMPAVSPTDGATRPRVAVQFVNGANLDTRSDLFWYPGSGLTPEQVLVYFRRQNRPPTAAATQPLRDLGLDWTVLFGWKPGRSDLQYARDVFRSLGVALGLTWRALAGRLPYGWWQWRVLVSMERSINWWTAFFREHHIRVHVHTGSTTLQVVPMSLAIEKAGGIDFGYQWSADDFNAPTTGRIVANHVYFAWGPYFGEQMRRLGAMPDVLLLGGSVFGYLASIQHDGSHQYRQRLLKVGCDYIVCLFDNSFHNRMYLTPRIMARFYETILQWVLADHRLGLVIKPKKQDNLLRLPQIMPMLNELVHTGRCLLLDASASHLEAALTANLAIGVGVNTAVLDAAIAGVPGVHLDLAALKRHPFHAAGDGQFVFSDAGALWEALQLHRAKAAEETSLGDHSPCLATVDPFRDGHGAERMGKYIRWFLESVEERSGWQEALAAASRRYAQEVGKEYIQLESAGSGDDRDVKLARS